MDDAFRMVAARMPRTRRLTPFAARATALLVVIGALVIAFGIFVTSAQHTADARRAQLAAAQRAQAEADAQAAEQIHAADITLLWRTNPHMDCRARGLECARLIAQTGVVT